MKSCLLVVILSLLLAVPAGLAQASPQGSFGVVQATPLEYVAVSVQPTLDPLAGKQEADTAFTANFNTLRVIMPWSYPMQADALNDKNRLCNVAAEAAAHRMKLFLDLVPVNAVPPVTSAQISAYDTTLGAYMSYVIGPVGCARGLSELDFQVDNEPNYEVFRPQATAPEDYSHLLIRTWRFVHKEAAKQGYSVPVKVIGGELASSHDPVGFMQRMAAEAQRWHVHGPFFDMFSYHCYGSDGSQLPTQPDTVEVGLQADFGRAVPLLCSEYAAGTILRTTSSARLASQSETLQGQLFCQAESMAVTKNLAGFAWFRLFDDSTGLPTGLYYYDPALGQQGDQPAAKSSMNHVPGYNAAALSGSLPVCG